jgi:hypothetical protein
MTDFGTEAFRWDNPSAKVVFYDTGHFALETHAAEIGAENRAFLSAMHQGGRNPERLNRLKSILEN